MKLILLCLLFSISTFAKTWKIQVFRISDGEQLYGLYASDANKAKRLAAANKVHVEGQTTLVVEDITAQIEQEKQDQETAKQERKNLKNLVNNVQDPIAKKILKRIIKDKYGE